MKCLNCGAENPNGAVVCVHCGNPTGYSDDQRTMPADSAYYGSQQQYTPQQQAPQQQYSAPQQPAAPQQQYAAPQQQPAAPTDPYNGHKMKWYKFLVYFALILSAIGEAGLSIMYLTKGRYEVRTLGSTITGKEAKDIVYSSAPGLKSLDIFVVICGFVMAAILLVAWFTLLKKKKIGPVCLYVFYLCDILYGVVSAVWMGAIKTGILSEETVTVLISSYVTTAVFGVILLILNFVYFKKRKDIFVN